MESNNTSTTTLPNQTNPNLNSNSYSHSNQDSDSIDENLPFIDYSSFERFNALSNDIGIEIFKAYWKNTRTYVALKKIQPRYLEDLNSFYKLSYHQNILSIFGYSQEPNNGDYFLVTDYANGGNLRQYLKDNHQNLSWNDKMRLVIDVTNGLQCMHSHDIVHLTLHPKNVFVQNHRLLIGYLGHAKAMDDVSDIDTETLPYIEPNFISDPTYPRDKYSDVYSLGFIMYEISSGKSPFASIRHSFEISKKILSGTREKPIVGTPIEYIDLYEQCWDNDPKLRPNVGDVLSRLGRMNLSPTYEETAKIMIAKKLKFDNNNHINNNNNYHQNHHFNNNNKKNEKPDYGTESENFSIGVTSGTSSQNNDIKIDFGNGIDSGFGVESQQSRARTRPTRRKCKILPCLPKLRVSYGVFLCWICVMMVIACAFLGIFLTGMLKKKK